MKRWDSIWLLLFFSISLLLGGCKPTRWYQTQTIVWEQNQLTVGISSERIQVGELLLVYFEGNLDPNYSFQIVHTKEAPLSSQFLHFSFQDINERKAVGELVWLEEGEKRITDLAVEFHCANGRKATFQLDPLVVDLFSTISLSEKSFPQSLVSLLSFFPHLNPPIAFSSYHPQKLLGGLGLFMFLLILLIAGISYFFYRRYNLKKKNNAYSTQCEIVLQQLKENPYEKKALLELYNLLIQGKEKLKKKKIRVDSSFYQSMILFLEKELFSPHPEKKEADLAQLIAQFEIWKNQWQKLQNDLIQSKKESI